MNKNKVFFDGAMTGEKKKVSLEELKDLSVAEQFVHLENCGYQRGLENRFIAATLNEWYQIMDADDGKNVKEDAVDLLSVEKVTVPFTLEDAAGKVIDEYNFTRLYYWDTDPARLIVQCWIKGGTPETVLTMPLTGTITTNGFFIASSTNSDYTLTEHDVKCAEEMFCFLHGWETKVVELANGQYALASHVWHEGKVWSGFPVCGDGNKKNYSAAIMRSLLWGNHGYMDYSVGEDDSMTFATEEAAYAWAERIGIKPT